MNLYLAQFNVKSKFARDLSPSLSVCAQQLAKLAQADCCRRRRRLPAATPARQTRPSSTSCDTWRLGETSEQFARLTTATADWGRHFCGGAARLAATPHGGGRRKRQFERRPRDGATRGKSETRLDLLKYVMRQENYYLQFKSWFGLSNKSCVSASNLSRICSKSLTVESEPLPFDSSPPFPSLAFWGSSVSRKFKSLLDNSRNCSLLFT